MASHRLLSSWYAQLAAHISAGTTLAEAFQNCAGPSRSGRISISNTLMQGGTIEQALANAPRWFPKADRKFIAAAAETGRLTEVFKRLSERHDSIGANQRKALFGLAYPVIIYHIASLVTPVLTMIDYENGFQWNPIQYRSQVALWIVPVWIAFIFLWLMKRWNVEFVFRIMNCLPVLRRYRKKQALANFSFTLSIFLNAGISILTAWHEAATLSNSSSIIKATRPVLATIEKGGDPKTAMDKSPIFPPDFKAFYSAGALSGQLEESLFNAGKQFQIQANTSATLASIIYPSLLFLLIAVRIIFIIFTVFSGYLDTVKNIFP